MPKVKISEYSATANSNTDVASINIDEGCAPSGINNAIRAIMGHLKDFQSGTSNDPFTVGSSGSLTLSYGTANGVAYLNGSKVLTTGSGLTWDGVYLGVGAVSPIYKIAVKGGNGNQLYIDNAGEQFTQFEFKNNGTTKAIQWWDNTNSLFVNYVASSALSFSWNQSSTEVMRLTSTGLSIGNTSPSSYNSSADNLVIGTSGSNGMTIVSGSTSSGYIMFADGTTGQQQYEGQITYDHTNNFMAFNTSGTERVHINSSGNLGLGVTPSAWSGSYYKVIEGGDGNNQSAIGFRTDTNGVELFVNAYFNGTNNIYKYTGTAGFYQLTGNTHQWYNAPSGTAGNAITFTQAMTLDASGNLLVGTTTLVSPNPGFSFAVGNSSQLAIGHASATTGTYYAYFNYNGSIIGSITQNGTTGVLYNLTSDYRLKNDQQALTGAKDFIMALKPKKWQWWDGSGEGVGFVAHEFMEVAKYSGHGEKDAVDAEGKPVYQSIQPSSSEVMANLVSFIQEQQALITQLTARITALEGA